MTANVTAHAKAPVNVTVTMTANVTAHPKAPVNVTVTMTANVTVTLSGLSPT
jgi:hypothetical protein